MATKNVYSTYLGYPKILFANSPMVCMAAETCSSFKLSTPKDASGDDKTDVSATG